MVIKFFVSQDNLLLYLAGEIVRLTPEAGGFEITANIQEVKIMKDPNSSTNQIGVQMIQELGTAAAMPSGEGWSAKARV